MCVCVCLCVVSVCVCVRVCASVSVSVFVCGVCLWVFCFCMCLWLCWSVYACASLQLCLNSHLCSCFMIVLVRVTVPACMCACVTQDSWVYNMKTNHLKPIYPNDWRQPPKKPSRALKRRLKRGALWLAAHNAKLLERNAQPMICTHFLSRVETCCLPLQCSSLGRLKPMNAGSETRTLSDFRLGSLWHARTHHGQT